MNSISGLCNELSILSSCFRKYSKSPVGALYAKSTITFLLAN